MIGETVDRLKEAASQLNAGTIVAKGKELSQLISESVGALEQKVGSGGRIFDLGEDAERLGGRSPIYAAEAKFLIENGFERVRSGYALVQGQVVIVYEWVKAGAK